MRRQLFTIIGESVEDKNLIILHYNIHARLAAITWDLHDDENDFIYTEIDRCIIIPKGVKGKFIWTIMRQSEEV